jgi:transposase-like protein
MVGEDKVLMSVKELRRLLVIHQVMEKKLRQVEASRLLGLTARQIRRISKRVQKEGDRGLAHRRRGKRSNRAFDERKKTDILRMYTKQYSDFGPTLAAEKLAERDGIGISDETLRLWLLEAGITHFRRRARPHRAWRERKAHRGELIQMDGSHHAWLEDRGPDCVLMAYIDDASNRVYARFYAYEGTIPAMDSFKRYLRRDGIPHSVYLDKHSTYKAWAKPSIAEQLAGRKPKSQFERALEELGVEVIHADSPQAKGRIERLFGTFQDRLIKEMRLANVRNLNEANQFLSGYLPIYNRRFSVKPVEGVDLHRPIPVGLNLDDILCIQTERTLRNDFTVIHNGGLYQVHDQIRAASVLVEERLDGSTRITHQGKRLRYQPIFVRPIRETVKPLKTKPRRPPKPPAPNHPWHRSFKQWREKSLPAPIS